VHAAGLPDGGYFWDNLSGKTLDDCRSNPSGRTMWPSDMDVGAHGIFDMSAFAELALPSVSPEVFERAAWEIVGKADDSLASTATMVKELAQTHAAEWKAFRDRFSADGFLNAC
jgi:hypothetical protein